MQIKVDGGDREVKEDGGSDNREHGEKSVQDRLKVEVQKGRRRKVERN